MTRPELAGVHPLLAYRVELLLADPALGDRYGVTSGARSVAQQRSLFNRYLRGEGNLAANPDRAISTSAGFPYSWTPRGSWHMVQPDGFAHAVDLKRPWWHTRAKARSVVHPLLPKYGLKATVSSEWWHVQALTSSGWVNGPQLPNTSEEEDDMIVLIDENDGKGWVCAHGRARPLSNVDQWLATWEGTVHRARFMGAVVRDLYQII